MSATVIVPWHEGEKERRDAWDFLLEWWRYQLPDLEHGVGLDFDDVGEPVTDIRQWSKGRAFEDVARVAEYDVLVLADADVMPHPAAIEAAIPMTLTYGWVVPYGWVYRLNAEATREVLDGDLEQRPAHRQRFELTPERGRYRGRPTGGCVVISRGAYEEVGGVDPRFEGWGGEDLAMATALRTLVGQPKRLDLPLWHLWHPPSPLQEVGGNIPPANSRLLVRYRKARKSRSRMRSLIAEHRGNGWLADHAEDGQLARPPARRPSV